MGPPSEKGGYVVWSTPHVEGWRASMGPPSEKGGYARQMAGRDLDDCASMGPPSENGGYECMSPCTTCLSEELQWVHRPRTVVMLNARLAKFKGLELQWVHRPRTVVM